MYCTKCGMRLTSDARFCPSCGNKIDTDKVQNSNISPSSQTDTYQPLNKFEKYDNISEISISSPGNSEIEKFDYSIRSLLHEECQKLSSVNHQVDLNSRSTIILSENEINYISSNNNSYATYDSLNTKNQVNINSSFRSNIHLGKKIGFIDGGTVIKNGKCGILFCEYGICVRGAMDREDTYILYHDLCAGIIRKSNKLSINPYKIEVTENLISIVEVSSKLYVLLINLRLSLLHNNENAKNLYNNIYKYLLFKIENDSIHNNLTDSINTSNIFNEFAESNRNEYLASHRITALVLMISREFNQARIICACAKDVEWVDFIKQKSTEFNDICSEELYNSATNEFNNKSFEIALMQIKESIKLSEKEKSWNLLINILYDGGTEENKYYHDEIDTLLRNPKSEFQKNAIAQENEKLKELEQKYLEFIKKQKANVLLALKYANVSYFSENTWVIDDIVNGNLNDYNISVLQYAALTCNKDLFKHILKLTQNPNQLNILGLNALELCAFATTNFHEYYSIVGSSDSWYHNILKKYNAEQLSLQIDKKIASYTISKTERVNRRLQKRKSIIEKSGNKFSDYDLTDTIEGLKRCNEEIIDHMEENRINHEDELEEHYQELKTKARDILVDALLDLNITIPPLLNSEATIDDFNKIPVYNEAYLSMKDSFISEYLHKNNDIRGEYETTTQFSERISNLKDQATQLFDSLALKKLFEFQDMYYNDTVTKKNQMNAAKEIITSSFILGNSEIDPYNADKEEFYIYYESFDSSADSYISIPIEIAPDFKSFFTDGVYLPEMNIINSELIGTDSFLELTIAYRVTFNNEKYSCIMEEVLL